VQHVQQDLSGSYLMAQRQVRILETLLGGYKVINTHYGEVIVRRRDGQLLRIQSDGRLVALEPVQKVQSYLQLNG
jgi:hypothetical protein